MVGEISMKLNQNNSALRVCVDSVTNGQIRGVVYGQRLEKPFIFADIGDLLLQIDDVLNNQDYPRAFQRKRSFGPETQPASLLAEELGGKFMSKEAVEAVRGTAATFSLNILMRQNTTWQGSVDWLDGRKPMEFSSALEFIRIVYETFKE